MNIKIDFVSEKNINAIMLLYKEADWLEEDDTSDFIPQIIQKSHCFLGAFLNEKLIGMGRAISDSNSDAYIQDIVVFKEYRKKGIGKMIVKKIVDVLKQDGISWIGLIGEPGTQHFYEALGFSTMKNHIPMKLNMD